MSSPSAQAHAARRGCEPCRAQHLKCDRRLPSCTECQKTAIQCTRYSDVRFKHVNTSVLAAAKPAGAPRPLFEFSQAQPWAPTGGSLRFLDETPDLVELYNHEHVYNPTDVNVTSLVEVVSPDGRSGLGQCTPIGTNPLNAISFQQLHKDGNTAMIDSEEEDHESLISPFEDESPEENTIPTTAIRPQTSSAPLDLVNENLEANPYVLYNAATDKSHFDSPITTTPAAQLGAWPLASAEEAKLLWYYVEHLSRSFDIVDPARHFRLQVPQRAIAHPTLLNAVFALSARHLSRLGKYDPIVSDRYHQKCLEHLIPMLNDAAAIRDENLLVSAIILRHLEEIDAPLTGQAPGGESGKSHLFGTHVLMTANEDAATAGGLRQAAFWVGLRQEIYMAFINQHSILPPLTHRNIDRSLMPASDQAWSNRMVVLCADVLRYCFGDEDTLTSTYYQLAEAVQQWYDSKPPTFNPVYYCEPDDLNVLPQLWFIRDEVTIGWQHYYITNILLGAHDPSVPRIGPRRAELLRKIDENIKEKVLLLCGICQSNPAVSPNFTYAAMAITVAGDKFVNLREREVLLHILDICDSQHALAIGRAPKDLKIAWGWSSPDS